MNRCLLLCLMPILMLLTHQTLYAKPPADRDPTQPAIIDRVEPGTEKDIEKKESYSLESIIISPTRRLALINSKFVKVGDKIGEAVVKEIGKNSVVLSQPGQQMTLYLFDQPSME